MIAPRHWHRFSVALLTAAALAGGLWPSASAIAAEEAGSPGGKKAVPRSSFEDVQVHVYHLRYAEASSIEDSLQKLSASLPIGGLAIDERGNRIFIVAQPDVHKRVASLVELLDTPAEEKDPSTVEVLGIQHADVNSVVAILSSVFPPEDFRIAADPSSNSIVVQASPEKLQTVRDLIKTVDRESEPRPDRSTTFRVRVVWLVSGLKADDAPEPGVDLRDVAGQLHNIGVTGVRQVGQAMVYTLPDVPFKMSCLPIYDKGPAEMKISGKLRDQDGTPSLSVNISAHQTVVVPVKDEPESEEEERKPAFRMETMHQAQVNLETEIAAPYGHYVVLGVTPVGTTTSAFVVQVTPSN